MDTAEYVPLIHEQWPLLESLRSSIGLFVGRGPLHPTNPEPRLMDAIKWLLRTHPGLLRDHGFVAFQLGYCGVFSESGYSGDEAYFGLEVRGFSPEGNQALHEGVIEQVGLLYFGHSVERTRPSRTQRVSDGITQHSYFIETAGIRKAGIYRLEETDAHLPIADEELARRCEWYIESFTAWLRRAAECNGRLVTGDPRERYWPDDFRCMPFESGTAGGCPGRPTVSAAQPQEVCRATFVADPAA